MNYRFFKTNKDGQEKYLFVDTDIYFEELKQNDETMIEVSESEWANNDGEFLRTPKQQLKYDEQQKEIAINSVKAYDVMCAI